VPVFFKRFQTNDLKHFSGKNVGDFYRVPAKLWRQEGKAFAAFTFDYKMSELFPKGSPMSAVIQVNRAAFQILRAADLSIALTAFVEGEALWLSVLTPTSRP